MGGDFGGFQNPGVGALHELYAGVDAQLVGDLTEAGVDGEDRGCAVLQHAVGEASGRSAHIGAGEAGHVDGPGFERVLQLEAAAAYVAQVLAEHADGDIGGDLYAGLVYLLLVDEDAAGENQGLRALARGGVPSVDQQLVQTKFQSSHPKPLFPCISFVELNTRRQSGCRTLALGSVTYRFGGRAVSRAKGVREIRCSLRNVAMMSNAEGTGPVTHGGADQDGQLLDRVRRGDEQAMGAVYDRYSKIVYSVALRVLRDTASAEDVLQDVFLGLWRRPETFVAARGSLGGWLAVVARNRAIDSLRRKRPSEQIEEVQLAAPYDLADEAQRNVMMVKARDIIQQLPYEQRKTLQMAYFDGLTHSEIAEVTGDPLGTIKTRIRTALLTLRKELQA